MTTPASLWIGIDVSKAELVIYDGTAARVHLNQPRAIRAWLRRLAAPANIAVEATGTYHCAVLEQAHRAGHRLFVVDGLRLSRYRDSIGGRAKTDLSDARLLHRYLQHEIDALRPWTPPPPSYPRLKALLSRRAKLVAARTALRHSLAGVPELRHTSKSLLAHFDQALAVIDRLLPPLAAQAGLQPAIKRLTGIEGIGPLIATALANAFQRGAFRSSDAFIAFFGMDVRVRDSGRHRGRRRLTKQGDHEMRRLLFIAAMAASRTARWKPIYQAYLDRGLSCTQSLVILARKLARIAFALLKNETEYEATPVQRGCYAT